MGSSSTPTELDILTAQAAAASSGVDNALIQAPADPGSNAITEQLQILNLPYGESIFPEEDDLTLPPDIGFATPPPSDGSGGGTVVSGAPVYTDPSAVDAPLSPLGGCPPPPPAAFSIFGLDTGPSVALVALGLFALFNGGGHGKGSR